MNAEITDESTAESALIRARDALKEAGESAAQAMAALRAVVVDERPRGILTVGEIAEAIGRDRNAVDTWYSDAGHTVKGKQTRVSADATDADRERSVTRLAAAAAEQRRTASAAVAARAERDRLIVLVYSSKLLGPSAIAGAVDVDRNHVLRIARKHGVKPAWRSGESVRNQYSAA